MIFNKLKNIEGLSCQKDLFRQTIFSQNNFFLQEILFFYSSKFPLRDKHFKYPPRLRIAKNMEVNARVRYGLFFYLSFYDLLIL